MNKISISIHVKRSKVGIRVISSVIHTDFKNIQNLYINHPKYSETSQQWKKSGVLHFAVITFAIHVMCTVAVLFSGPHASISIALDMKIINIACAKPVKILFCKRRKTSMVDSKLIWMCSQYKDSTCIAHCHTEIGRASCR